MLEYSDEFFINLVMKLSEKDQEVYNTWAVWCDESKNKYYISSRINNGEIEYFTQERPAEEVIVLNKIDALREYIDNLKLDMRKKVNKEYLELADKFINSEEIKTREFISYEKFVDYKEKSTK